MLGRIVIVALALAATALADLAADGHLTRGVKEFGAAFAAWDGTRFASATSHFERAAKASPASAAPRYWEGVSRFHRMLYLRNGPTSAANNRSADGEMESAITALRAAIALDGTHAESHALLGTLIGMKIQGSALRAMRHGRAVNEHRGLALHHGHSNPRVRYLSGAGLFHTAKNHDDYRKALAELRAAEKLFTAESRRPARPGEPRWGASSCQTFIGRTYEKLGQPREALAAYRRALAAHPADHIATAAARRLGGGG